MILVLHCTDCDSFEIINALDWFCGECVPETGFHKTDYMEAQLLGISLDEISQLSVHGRMSLIYIRPEVCLIQDVHIRDKVSQNGVCSRCDIQVVGHCQLDRISFAAEGTSGINRYFDSSVCCLLNLFRDFLCAFSIRGGLRVN